ncbi:MAG TPA: Bax inhibitor-1/YccA family protein [Sulfurovum sp.]|nr:Bax inhibitor-1/YccA family protein [Sulfurovum sp.]HIM94270.1 Bax inhibitor-1/YccA family protein [Campylobacterales bacterium]
MALYDRGYTNNSDNSMDYAVENKSAGISLVKKTYQYFAASLLAGGFGAYAGITIIGASVLMEYRWFIFIPWMLFGMFALPMLKNKELLATIALFVFTFMGGIVLTPLISMVMAKGGGATVGNAFLLASAMFAGLSLFAINSKTDFTSYGKPLMIAFGIVFIGSILNIIFFSSPIFSVIISGAVLMISAFFVLVDTQNIVAGAYETPVMGALSLYLNFFNMFQSLLVLLGIMDD